MTESVSEARLLPSETSGQNGEQVETVRRGPSAVAEDRDGEGAMGRAAHSGEGASGGSQENCADVLAQTV